MAQSIKIMASIGLFVLVAACENSQEVVPEPISSEPVYDNKLE